MMRLKRETKKFCCYGCRQMLPGNNKDDEETKIWHCSSVNKFKSLISIKAFVVRLILELEILFSKR